MEKGISIQTLHRKILFLPEAIEIRTEMYPKDSSVLQWLMAKLEQMLDSRRWLSWVKNAAERTRCPGLRATRWWVWITNIQSCVCLFLGQPATCKLSILTGEFKLSSEVNPGREQEPSKNSSLLF